MPMIPIDLSGKNALVTGGTRGIGRTISLRLAQAGARVAMLYRADSDTAEETLDLLDKSSNGSHRAFKADIADADQTDRAMRDALSGFGEALDIVVCNAASGAGGTVAESAMADWRRPFEVNVHGHVHVLQRALPAMRP